MLMPGQRPFQRAYPKQFASTSLSLLGRLQQGRGVQLQPLSAAAYAMHGWSEKPTSMRASAVTKEPLSACRHSVQTLLPASCAFLELATSCAASLALSRFSDVALAACKTPNLQSLWKSLMCRALSCAPESLLCAAKAGWLTFSCNSFAFLRACSLSFCKVCASSCNPGHLLGGSLLRLSLPYDCGCAISCGTFD